MIRGVEFDKDARRRTVQYDAIPADKVQYAASSLAGYFDSRAYGAVLRQLAPLLPQDADRPPPSWTFPVCEDVTTDVTAPEFLRRRKKKRLAQRAQGSSESTSPGLASNAKDLHRTNPGRDDDLSYQGPPEISSLNLDGWLRGHREHCSSCSSRPLLSVDQYLRTAHQHECYFSWLFHSLAYGYRPRLRSPPSKFEFTNYKSVYDQTVHEQIRKAWAKQLEAGAFEECISKPDGISPFTAATRFCDRWEAKIRGQIPKHRLCLDLSKGFNPHVEAWRLRYSDFASHLHMLRPGTWLAQVDLKSFYMMLPLHAALRSWFAVREPVAPFRLLQYRRIPFGLSTAPAFASMVSAEALAIIQRRLNDIGARALVYIDDFCIFAPSKKVAQLALTITLQTLGELGLPVSEPKVVLPTQRATILGVEVDTEARTIGVKPDHVRYTLLALDDMLSRSRVRRRDFHSMCGMMVWMAAITRGGKAHLRPLFRFLTRMRYIRRGKAQLSSEVRECLLWWAAKLREGRATSQWLLPDADSPRCATDASGEFACGGFFEFRRGGDRVAVQHKWSPVELDYSIAAKELLPIVNIAELAGPAWRGSAPLAFTDSQAVAFMLLTGHSPCPVCNALLVRLADLQEKYDFELLPAWRSRDQMQLADILTRPSVIDLAVPVQGKLY